MASGQININKDLLIEFVNLVNECCAIMEDSYVAEWLSKPNADLNMETPLNLLKDKQAEKVYRLLYFIDRDEADL